MRGTANASYQHYSHKAFVPIELQIQCSAGGGVGQIDLFPSSNEVHGAHERNMRENGMHGLASTELCPSVAVRQYSLEL